MNSIADGSIIIQSTSESVPSTPSWFGEVVLMATYLRKQGILTKISEQVRFARRRFGQYEVIDFVVVLFGYAISGERTLEIFYERLQPFAVPFMALFGRDRLPVRSTLSRFLAALLVLSGSVNLDGVVEIRASKRSAESKYAQIVHLVEEAQTQKAPIHRLADRYSIVLTVVAVALAGLAWALSGQSVSALAVLVVATPCPLILATPIAIMSGIDLAARHGLIAKSGASIEQLGRVDIAVFDKTGTLTLGLPKMTAIVLASQAPQESDTAAEHATLLRLAASVEQLSTHILAHAVVEAAQTHALPLSAAEDFEEIFGKGGGAWTRVASARRPTGRVAL